MNDFNHSDVLFLGDDGLPLEFNIRNANEKVVLKALIEHGGGICCQNESAVHLISPETKVLNADTGKMLVCTRYIFDCVKANYLLEVNDYVFTISEAQTSDISDEDCNSIQSKQTSISNANIRTNPNIVHVSPIKNRNCFDILKSPRNKQCALNQIPIQNSSSSLSESSVEGYDEDKESLAQSYTVSSSADAQIAGEPNSANVSSTDIFGSKPYDIPDSPGENLDESFNIEEYITKLEEDVEQILLKPSPKSIQDKILLVKYICCIKKLPASTVLQSLQEL